MSLIQGQYEKKLTSLQSHMLFQLVIDPASAAAVASVTYQDVVDNISVPFHSMEICTAEHALTALLAAMIRWQVTVSSDIALNLLSCAGLMWMIMSFLKFLWGQQRGGCLPI